MKILVTGGKGQLGQELEGLVRDSGHDGDWIFASSQEADITDREKLETFFEQVNPDIIVNCAAYTAVDKAEEDEEMAKAINVDGVRNLAELAKDKLIIHVSTDFVFDGTSHIAYKEDVATSPLGVYGQTKLDGEKALLETAKNAVVLRTSWLYGSYANNFMKTMLRLAETRSELNVVADQIGTPTYTGDLAKAIIQIVDRGGIPAGVYHFSNEGVTSWYGFAHSIFDLAGLKVKVKPIPSAQYPTPAQRPHFSVLDKTKIKQALGIEIPHWRDSLKEALKRTI
ncbi:dTDP-4-dehydrorhamnose reductase [Litoribacter ruber]|uniref:dTDP-4-dehydrorhamnose reductase n=1 Tax=Litoribacter ruber TaxID=702568 RepID=UPI001BD93082|nr:dTDP-4-dehydrorhamnose reductase [Litoribacter ruber]MBT0812123.1 dTDP-4-dehydrorhamnose reductase [Litoribacter ruber]